MTEDEPNHFYRIYHKILNYAHQDFFAKEREIAKNFYEIRKGFPADDDATFLARTNDFLDDFTFHFRLSETGRTPFEQFLCDHETTVKPSELKLYEQFRTHYSSLFEITHKRKKNLFLLTDLINKTTYKVHLFLNSDCFFYLNRGEVIIAKIFQFEKESYLSPGLTTQPFEAKKHILKILKSYQKSKNLYQKTDPQTLITLKTFLNERKDDYLALQKEKTFKNSKLSDKLTFSRDMRKFSKKYLNKDFVLKFANTEHKDPFLEEDAIVKTEPLLDLLMRCELKYRTYKHLSAESIYVSDPNISFFHNLV
jgi:hypothetical protein